jgi:hypothetical protein
MYRACHANMSSEIFHITNRCFSIAASVGSVSDIITVIYDVEFTDGQAHQGTLGSAN